MEVSHNMVDNAITTNPGNLDSPLQGKPTVSSDNVCLAKGISLNKIDLLIVDVDSSDSR